MVYTSTDVLYTFYSVLAPYLVLLFSFYIFRRLYKVVRGD